MSSFKQILVFLSLSLFVASCGDDEKGKKTNPKNNDSVSDPYIKSLMGTWTRTCTQGQKLVAKVGAKEVTVSAEIFSDAGCTASFLSFSSSATYTPGAAWKSQTNAKALSFVFGGVSLTPKSANAVKLMNQGKVCGFQNWTLGQSKPINVGLPNCQNADFAELKSLQNQIFQVESNVLKIFKTNGSASSPLFILTR